MKISLNEMIFYGFHGVFDEERRLGQRFTVSVHLFTDDCKDSFVHHLDDTVDYTKVYANVKAIMEGKQFHLLENCANTILEMLLSDFPLLVAAEVIIQKPSVAIQGSLQSVEVVMKRNRL